MRAAHRSIQTALPHSDALPPSIDRSPRNLPFRMPVYAIFSFTGPAASVPGNVNVACCLASSSDTSAFIWRLPVFAVTDWNLNIRRIQRDRVCRLRQRHVDRLVARECRLVEIRRRCSV